MPGSRYASTVEEIRHEEKRFYHMIMKYKKNISSADEDMDMEQVLQVYHKILFYI